MLSPQPTTLNPVTILEASCLPHPTNPSRAAGSLCAQHVRPLGGEGPLANLMEVKA